jgi:exonuclease SbcD
MRILHLADLHLGKIFHDVHLTDDQAHILEQIVAIARDQKVGVVAISGDVYDRSVPPVQATVVMDEFLSRLLLDLKVTVILTPGNHDSAERLAFACRLVRRQGLHIAPGLPGIILPVQVADRHGPVTFYPLPYVEPFMLRKSLDDPEIGDFDGALARVLGSLPVTEGRSVCLAHCFTQGGETSESERPLTIGGSGMVATDHFQRFNLALLGHLHRPQQISGTVFYAGSPLKYSFSEASHTKQVAIYDLAADGTFTRETVPLAPLREVRTVTGELAKILAGADTDPGREDYLWVELTDRGALFDYSARIRTVYPNVLNITRAAYQREGDSDGSIEIRNKSETEIVDSFFRHVTGQGLNPAEDAVMQAVLAEMLRGTEGSAL